MPDLNEYFTDADIDYYAGVDNHPELHTDIDEHDELYGYDFAPPGDGSVDDGGGDDLDRAAARYNAAFNEWAAAIADADAAEWALIAINDRVDAARTQLNAARQAFDRVAPGYR